MVQICDTKVDFLISHFWSTYLAPKHCQDWGVLSKHCKTYIYYQQAQISMYTVKVLIHKTPIPPPLHIVPSSSYINLQSMNFYSVPDLQAKRSLRCHV